MKNIRQALHIWKSGLHEISTIIIAVSRAVYCQLGIGQAAFLFAYVMVDNFECHRSQHSVDSLHGLLCHHQCRTAL